MEESQWFTDDALPGNNVMRHYARDLLDDEEAQIQAIKDDALTLWETINVMGQSREISHAKTKIEEAVMWAVKHITA